MTDRAKIMLVRTFFQKQCASLRLDFVVLAKDA